MFGTVVALGSRKVKFVTELGMQAVGMFPNTFELQASKQATLEIGDRKFAINLSEVTEAGGSAQFVQKLERKMLRELFKHSIQASSSVRNMNVLARRSKLAHSN